MQSRLTFVYCFYDNSRMLEEQYRFWATYPNDLRNKISVILVDDASPRPAIDVRRPPGLPELSIYRVVEDIPWHQDGARNLGAKMAPDGWLLCCDIDHVLPIKSLSVLLEATNKFHDGVFFTFPRLEAPDLRRVLKGPGANIFAVTKNDYWEKMKGYDEDMCGQYGSDSEPRRRLLKQALNVVLDRAPLIRYDVDVIADARTIAWERRGPEQNQRRKQALERKRKLGRMGQITHLDFEWLRVL